MKISVKQCAEKYGVTTETVYNWIEKGKVKTSQTSAGQVIDEEKNVLPPPPNKSGRPKGTKVGDLI